MQPYAQSSLINRPYPMLAKKYYGPYTVLQKIGNDAYRLDLPPSSLIHPTFHVSQLKAFTPDHTSVFLNYLQWSAWTGLMSCLKLYWIVVSLKKATMLSRRYSSSGPSSLLHWQPGNRGVPPKPETQCKILRWDPRGPSGSSVWAVECCDCLELSRVVWLPASESRHRDRQMQVRSRSASARYECQAR